MRSIKTKCAEIIFCWKSSAILSRCLILRGQFVYAVTPVSPYISSITLVFLSFMLSFWVSKCFWSIFLYVLKHESCFWYWFFWFCIFCHLDLYTCVNKTFCLIKNVHVKLILFFSWFYRGTFGAWGQNFYVIFQEWNLCILEQNSPYFFLVIMILVRCCF